MLEVLVALLQSYSDYLKSFLIVENTEAARPREEMAKLGVAVMSVLGDLLTGGGGGNGENAAVLRKLGGAAAIVSLIRKVNLKITNLPNDSQPYLILTIRFGIVSPDSHLVTSKRVRS